MPKQSIYTLTGIILFLISSLNLNAQLEAQKFYYGFMGGASYSSIGDIQTTLIRPIFPEGSFTATNKRKVGALVGGFVYYKFKDSKLAIQPEIYYAQLGGQFGYEDIEGLTYDIGFNYGYMNISPILKFYTVHGLYAATGMQLSLILDRSSLTYNSSQPELGPDLQIQQSLREVLKGNSKVAFVLGAGYDTPFGLNVNARWSFGLSDAVETLANGFYFIENKNLSSSFQITVGYHIPFFN